MSEILLANAILVLVTMIFFWLVSIPVKDVSFIDSVWGLGFVLIAWNSWYWSGGPERATLILVLTSLWGLRLAAYLFARWRRDGQDPRYKKIVGDRKNPHLFTLYFVFLLQGVMMWIVSLPVQIGAGSIPTDLGTLAWVGAGLSLVGIVLETTADAQMNAFRTNPDNKGKVMDRGVWRYSRHPNYFADACVWWGLWLICADGGNMIYALPGPLLLTWTLMKWSGVPLLERNLKKHRPSYADYAARTSAFIPWFPKKAAAVNQGETTP